MQNGELNARTFVMGDIHGNYRALMQCLEISGFDYQNDTLIQLGDITDGNEAVFECVEELLKIRNLIAVKGNHDDWFLDFIETDYHPVSWSHGGRGTIMSYLEHCQDKGICIAKGTGYKTSLNSSDIPPRHRQFFQDQKLYHIDDQNRCFVHGGFDRLIPFRGQREKIYYWDRTLWTEALSYLNSDHGSYKKTPFLEIFIGHTPTTNWDTDKPMKAFNIINLDTGAGGTGKLTIMDVDTKEYWQSDYFGNW